MVSPLNLIIRSACYSKNDGWRMPYSSLLYFKKKRWASPDCASGEPSPAAVYRCRAVVNRAEFTCRKACQKLATGGGA